MRYGCRAAAGGSSCRGVVVAMGGIEGKDGCLSSHTFESLYATRTSQGFGSSRTAKMLRTSSDGHERHRARWRQQRGRAGQTVAHRADFTLKVDLPTALLDL